MVAAGSQAPGFSAPTFLDESPPAFSSTAKASLPAIVGRQAKKFCLKLDTVLKNLDIYAVPLFVIDKCGPNALKRQNEQEVKNQSVVVDFSLCSTNLLFKFIDHLHDESKLGHCGRLGYIDAISEMIDFKKTSWLVWSNSSKLQKSAKELQK